MIQTVQLIERHAGPYGEVALRRRRAWGMGRGAAPPRFPGRPPGSEGSEGSEAHGGA